MGTIWRKCNEGIFFTIRHGFHQNFATQTIWVMHLAVCDLIFCIFSAPMYFVAWLGTGYIYPQGYGVGTMCSMSIANAYFTVYNDWLLLAFIAMTRAINLKWPHQWRAFCNNKIYVALLLLLPWIIQCFIIGPWLIQVLSLFPDDIVP